MRTRTTHRIPGDGQWHMLPELGPILQIDGPLDVMVAIDDHGRGKARAPADGVERTVDYVIGARV